MQQVKLTKYIYYKCYSIWSQLLVKCFFIIGFP